jgi:hypothetical protein
MEDILPVVSTLGVGESVGAGLIGVAVVEEGVAMIETAVIPSVALRVGYGATVGMTGFFVGPQETMLLPKTVTIIIPIIFQPGRKVA